MTRGSVSTPSSTATSGKTSWMLNTNGARRGRATASPAGPSVSGGDMASTTSGRLRRDGAAAAVERGEPAEGEGPGRDVALVGRERVDAGDAAPRRRPRGARAVAPPQPGSTAVVLGTRAAR